MYHLIIINIALSNYLVKCPVLYVAIVFDDKMMYHTSSVKHGCSRVQ